MSPEDPTANAATPEKGEATAESAASQAVAEWGRLNGVPASEIPNSVKPSEKISAYHKIFESGARTFLTGFLEKSSLDVGSLKTELDSLRAAGDVVALGKREEEIAKLFQNEIGTYGYEGATSHPADILENKEMNCVGASFIGGMLLEEVGIRSLFASGGSHAFLMVVTSDNRILWQDMQDGKELPEKFNQELTDQKIIGTNTGDVSELAHTEEGSVTFTANITGWEDKPITLSPFRSGIEEQELVNTGFKLSNDNENNSDKQKESIEILEVAKHQSPQNPDIYLGLSRALRRLGRYEEAFMNCKKVLELDPTHLYVQEEIDTITKLAAESKIS